MFDLFLGAHLTLKMVYFVRVLSSAEAAAHQRDVLLVRLVVGLVPEHLHPLAAPGLGLGGLGHRVQLCD